MAVANKSVYNLGAKSIFQIRKRVDYLDRPVDL